MRFGIVPHRSSVSIRARSNVHPINTETKGLTGWLDLDVRNGHLRVPKTAGGHIELDVEKLRSGNPLQDRELRRRIDARRFPTITGDVASLRRSGDERLIVEGALTFRGVTRTYEDAVTVEVLDDATIAVRGESTFDIRDFDMEPPRILMFRVEPQVRVRIDVIAERET